MSRASARSVVDDKAERSEAVVVVISASSSDSEDELRLLLWTVLCAAVNQSCTSPH